MFDFYYQYGGNGTGAAETAATIHFEQSGTGYKDPNGAAQEKIGNITIFNPMMDAPPDRSADPPTDARQVKTVTAYILEDGKTSTVTLPTSYELSDANSQILRISVASSDAVHYRFDQVQNITISYDAPS